MAIRKLTTRFNPNGTVMPIPRRMIGIASGADAASLAVLRQLGITRVRTSLYWGNYLDTRQFAPDRSTVVSSGGKTVAQFFTADLAAFAAAGIEVLVVVHTPPVGMTFAQGIVAMPTFMAGVAAAHPGMRWQIMNEMDAGSVFNGGAQDWFQADAAVSQNTRGDRYGQVLGPTYDAIKAADPTATVVAGGIALEPTAFFAGLSGRAPGKYDAIAVHCYGSPTNGVFQSKSIAMRAVLGSTPLWVTEFGNNQSDQATQAADIGIMLDDNDRHARYDRAYLYTLVGDPPYGLVEANGGYRHASLLLTNRTAP